jgi:hypothetical protein
MRPAVATFDAPSFDRDLRFPDRIGNLPFEAFVAQLPVEAFAVAILPRLPGSMYRGAEPTAPSHRRNPWAIPARSTSGSGHLRRFSIPAMVAVQAQPFREDFQP